MSWSVSAIGKPAGVARAIEDQFARSTPCVEPEETVRQNVRSAIKMAIDSLPDKNVAVRVEASGSMSFEMNGVEPRKVTASTVNVKVETLWNFVDDPPK
jgi:hypothetical protein